VQYDARKESKTMSDISKFADELEQLILSHAAEAGIDIAEGLVEHLIEVVTRCVFNKDEEEQDDGQK